MRKYNASVKIQFNKTDNKQIDYDKLNKKFLKCNDEWPATDSINWFHILHDKTPDDRYVVFRLAPGLSDGEEFQISLLKSEITDSVIQNIVNNAIKYNYNLYMTVSSFYKRKRTSENACSTNTVVIDLDYYKKPEYENLSPKDFVKMIDYKGFSKPSCVAVSGKGIYLVWKLEDNVWLSSGQADAMIKQLKRNINVFFAKYNTDFSCMDNSRVVRLVGSNHYKDGVRRKSYIIEHTDKEYNIKSLLKYFGDENVPKTEFIKPVMPDFDKRTKNTRQVPSHAFVPDIDTHWKNVAETRVEDLLKLAEIRDYDFGTGSKYYESSRNNFLHLIATYYFYCKKEATEVFNLVEYVNSQLTSPLKLSEIQNIVNSANKNNINRISGTGNFYKYSPNKIIEMLNISIEEQRQLQKIHDDELRKVDKENYNREYYKKKSEKRKQDKAEAIERELTWAAQLMKEGLTIKQMADEMGCGVTKIKELRKKVREND